LWEALEPNILYWDPLMEEFSLKGLRVTVLGAGRTGLATARFLSEKRAKVFLSEQASLAPSTRRELEALGIAYEEGGHTERALRADLIVPSPGVPSEAPLLREARRRGLPIWSELELAFRFCPSEKIIAITGTVGKTTTTRLITEILRAYGHRAVPAGNIGRPLIACLGEIDEKTTIVVEVSSFQLEHVSEFKPHIGVFTRFAPHHLDRHGNVEHYFATKCRLFARQTEGDFAVIQNDLELPCSIRSRVLKFSAEDINLDGRLYPHQREDLAAALMAARLIDPSIQLGKLDLERALRLPHRLEFVAEVCGVRFYNDSKATSPVATQAALEAFGSDEAVALILGGYDEGGDLSGLARAICERGVSTVLLMGSTGERWARSLRAVGYERFIRVGDLNEAVAAALELRPKPHICLLSPAAPSFDRFPNYRERGERFRRIVHSYALRLQTPITRSSDQMVVPS